MPLQPLPLRCTPLHNACLTIQPPQPSCSSQCATQPFRIDLYGKNATQERSLALKRKIRDPLNSFYPRSLEKNIHVRAPRRGKGINFNASAAATLSMIWPWMERSHGGLWRSTLIPLGHLLVAGQLPPALALSGVHFSQPLAGLANVSRLCAFERTSVPGLVPRCSSSCVRELRICELGRWRGVTGDDAHRAVAALDAALTGAPPPSTDGRHRARGQLQVCFAVRRRGRRVINLDAVVESCDSTILRGWKLHCSAVHLGELSAAEVVRVMRAADVYVSMHGGDVIHAAHMLRGRRVVELVNEGFHLANRAWLNENRATLRPILVFHRLVMPASNPINYSGINMSQILRARTRGVLLEEPERRLREIVRAGWNANATLSWVAMRRTLEAIINESQRWEQVMASKGARSKSPPLRAGVQHFVDRPAKARAGAENGSPPSQSPIAPSIAPVVPARPLVVLIAYFGAWPAFFPMVLESMGGVNIGRVDFFVIGDSEPPAQKPPNVHFVRASWWDLQQRVVTRLGVQPARENQTVRCEAAAGCTVGWRIKDHGDGAAAASLRKEHLFHTQKATDYKPFLAGLFPELVANASWWAWGDLDVVFGDLMKFIDNAEPANATVVCPLYPNPWQVVSWGVFTAFRLDAGWTNVDARELFRHSGRWRAVLQTRTPLQFDEWWGKPPHHWRMSQTMLRLSKRGRVVLSKAAVPIAEADACKSGAQGWMPCGAVSWRWTVRGGLRVNGAGEAMLLHLSVTKGAWPAGPATSLIGAECLEGDGLGAVQRQGSAPSAGAPTSVALDGNRPPAAVASLVQFGPGHSRPHIRHCSLGEEG